MLALALLAACDVRRWRDETPPGRARPDDPVATADTAAPCPEGQLGPAPDALAGDTTGRSDDHAGSCGGEGAGDVVVAFTADADGVYAFDTAGSAYDAVLYALDGCDGAELACGSPLELELAAGETVWLVVDGRDGEEGPFALDVAAPRAPCADFALPATLPSAGAGDTTGAGNDDGGTCGGDTAPDHAWSWTAPSAGTYTIDTLGADYDTVLYVRDGCGGPVLACNDDAPSGTVLQSELTVTLAAGQQIVVIVDGYGATSAGGYALGVR